MGSSSSVPDDFRRVIRKMVLALLRAPFLPGLTEFIGLMIYAKLERERIERLLPSEDIDRLIRMKAIYVSKQGKLVSISDDTFTLIDWDGNHFIPTHALLPPPYAFAIGHKFDGGNYVRGELSAALKSYIWPLEQEFIHVQFRTPVPSFESKYIDDNIQVVFSNNGGDDSGEYCIAACNNGTIKCLPQIFCRNGNHIWTVYLFDPPSKGLEVEVHFSSRLKRGSDVQTGLVINNHVGGNFNGSGSTQNIGSANFHIN